MVPPLLIQMELRNHALSHWNPDAVFTWVDNLLDRQVGLLGHESDDGEDGESSQEAGATVDQRDHQSISETYWMAHHNRYMVWLCLLDYILK